MKMGISQGFNILLMVLLSLILLIAMVKSEREEKVRKVRKLSVLYWTTFIEAQPHLWGIAYYSNSNLVYDTFKIPFTQDWFIMHCRAASRTVTTDTIKHSKKNWIFNFLIIFNTLNLSLSISKSSCESLSFWFKHLQLNKATRWS